MQYQPPGSWYIPMNMQLQKLLPLSLSPMPADAANIAAAGGSAVNGAANTAYAPANFANVNCHIFTNPKNPNLTFNSLVNVAHNYHPQLNEAYQCNNIDYNAAQELRPLVNSMPHTISVLNFQSAPLRSNATHAHNTSLLSAPTAVAHQTAAAANAAAIMFAPYQTLPAYLNANTATGSGSCSVSGSTSGSGSGSGSAPAITNPFALLSAQHSTLVARTNPYIEKLSQTLTCVSPSSPTTTNSALTAAATIDLNVLALRQPIKKENCKSRQGCQAGLIPAGISAEKTVKTASVEKRKADDTEQFIDLKKAKLETKALKAKRPGFTDERYQETSYYIENGLRKVYPYYFTFTTFTKGRWVGEKILEVFAREFRAHPVEEYERCINTGTLTVNYEKVPTDYLLKHNDLLANIVHRHEVPVTSQPITIVHMDDDIVVVNKPASIPVHPCGRYRHNTVVFILAKEYNLKNLRTIHRLDRLTSGLLLFGRSPKKARQMEHQIRNRQVQKEYICRVEGKFPEGVIECKEPIEVISYKIGVCKVSSKGKDCTTTFERISYNGITSVVLCKPLTGRMHQIRVHLQYLGHPIVNDPLYNHEVFGSAKGRGGDIDGKTDEQLIHDLITIHNAENWLGIDGTDADISLFRSEKNNCEKDSSNMDVNSKLAVELNDNESEIVLPNPNLAKRMQSNTETSDNGMVENYPELHQQCLNINATPANCLVTKQKSTQPNNGDSSESNGVDVDSDSQANSAGNNCTQGSNTNHPYVKVTVGTQTGHESPDMLFNADKMTTDHHCYECKVRYRDPKPKNLVMYLHAWKYQGPDWHYETELPNWANADWIETDQT